MKYPTHYKPSKTVYKAVEPPLVIILLTALVETSLKNAGVEIETEKIGAIVTILYGSFKGFVNFVKNKIPK